MDRILICMPAPGDGTADPRIAARAAALQTGLVRSGNLRVTVLRVDPSAVLDLAAQEARAVIATGYAPRDIGAFGALRLPCIWDMEGIGADTMAAWLADPEARAAVQAALGVCRSTIGIVRDTALLIEDAFMVGLSAHTPLEAVAACRESVAIILGAGLGNMVYGSGMVRWVSETLGAPVDLIIHDRFDAAVALFAGAPWLNAVYPGFEYRTGLSYRLLISSVTGGAMRPPFEADQTLWLNVDHSYNEEGRFIPEPQLNFLGLEKVFGHAPGLTCDIPAPFIRDITYVHPGTRVLGVANGQKGGAWAKREWPHIPELVASLLADGWEVRSFGLPGEYVEGARDMTGLPMRQVVEEIAKCAYFLSYDGGLCHIAEVVGVPTVWLFGSTGPVKNGPVFSHSRALLSYRDCGPCLYKVDWLRCNDPVCMGDLTIAGVRDTLEALRLRVEAEGLDRRPPAMDDRVLDYEIMAQHRPPPPALRAQYIRERTVLLGNDRKRLGRLVLGRLRDGDILSAAALTSHMLTLWPDSPATRFFFLIARQAHPGPTPVAGTLAALPCAPLSPDDMVRLLDDLVALDLDREDRQFIMQAGLRLWMQPDALACQMAFLDAMLGSTPFARDQIRPLQRYLERVAPAGFADALRSIDFESSPSQMRMRSVLKTPVRQQFERAALQIGSAVGLGAEEVLAGSFVPHLRAVDRHLHRPVTLTLGDRVHVLPHYGTVLMLVPHVTVKHAMAASTSNLILQHATRLAMLGLRPVIVTTGFDDIKDLWTMRDSVTFVQGHRHWDAAQWQGVQDVFAPSLWLAYGAADHDLALPPALRAALQRVDADGLSDGLGMLSEYQAGNRWECPERGQGAAADVQAEMLSEVLFVPPDRRSRIDLARPRVFVLLPDAADFLAVTALAAAMPEVDFTVMTPFVSRGIEKNLTTVPVGELKDGMVPPDGILMHFASRPAALCAEMVQRVEQGGLAIAAARLPAGGVLARHVVTVETPGTTGGWVRALRRLVRQAYQEQMLTA